MKKIIYVCDRCKKDIADKTIGGFIANYWNREEDSLDKVDFEMDFCHTCMQLITDVVLGGEVPVPVEAIPEKEEVKAPEVKTDPEKKPVKKTATDYGKIKALTDAGWSAAKIADEMGITEAAVYNARWKIKQNMR